MKGNKTVDNQDKMTDRIDSGEVADRGKNATFSIEKVEEIINKVERVKRMQQIYSGKHASRGAGEASDGYRYQQGYRKSYSR